MKHTNRMAFIQIGFATILVLLILLGGKALAQRVISGTEPGEELIEMAPSYISGDPAYQNITPPDDNPKAGINSPMVNYTYYLVSGSTLRGRSSVTQYSYDAYGCSHTVVGTGQEGILNTELNLPENSVIKYLRVYYIDTNPTSGVEGFITRYQPGQSKNDLVYTGSTDGFVGGYGIAVSQEITETVHNTDYVYTLIGWPDVNNVANQICGLRVAYYSSISVNFSAIPTSGPVPLTVVFNNLTTGNYDTCLWDFGDGQTSTLCSPPDHIYLTPGDYTVTLTASGMGGSDSETRIGYIMVVPNLFIPVVHR